MTQQGHYVKFMPRQIFSINTINKFPYGLAARIPGFHPGGPGSTPGMGKLLYFFINFLLKHRKNQNNHKYSEYFNNVYLF